MKKIFAKELAALAVLALAFTGCNTAFDGTNANFAEKEAEYTDISGAAASFSGDNKLGKIEYTIPAGATYAITKNNNKNVVNVKVTSFSKINIESADKAIHFQQLTNNSTSGYYPIRGADLPKTRIKVEEGTVSTETFTTTITYEVNGTGVTTDKVALFVDAKELKTKGGSAVLALDANTKRGEESDSYITYLSADGTTAITGVNENFRPTYALTTGTSTAWLVDTNSKEIGKRRFGIQAADKNYNRPGTVTPEYESGLAAKLNDIVVLQYRKPGSRTYAETKLSWTYHETASTATPLASDPFGAHTYTADYAFEEVGTEYRLVLTNPDGVVAPDWYKEVYGHPAIVYGASNGVGKKVEIAHGSYTLHKTVPSYIVVTRAQATSGSDYTSSYNPNSFDKADIKSAQASFFSVTATDNWFQVSTTGTAELDPAAAKDFIVVDANNKKIDADVDVITYSYNDSNTLSGKVQYVKITVKDVRYRNSLPTLASGAAVANRLHVCVGAGTKIKENKMYPAQLTFGQWKDVTDDDASGYVQIN